MRRADLRHMAYDRPVVVLSEQLAGTPVPEAEGQAALLKPRTRGPDGRTGWAVQKCATASMACWTSLLGDVGGVGV